MDTVDAQWNLEALGECRGTDVTAAKYRDSSPRDATIEDVTRHVVNPDGVS
jgi:hypothetical protein